MAAIAINEELLKEDFATVTAPEMQIK